jgi:hypothetical protein
MEGWDAAKAVEWKPGLLSVNRSANGSLRSAACLDRPRCRGSRAGDEGR